MKINSINNSGFVPNKVSFGSRSVSARHLTQADIYMNNVKNLKSIVDITDQLALPKEEKISRMLSLANKEFKTEEPDLVDSLFGAIKNIADGLRDMIFPTKKMPESEIRQLLVLATAQGKKNFVNNNMLFLYSLLDELSNKSPDDYEKLNNSIGEIIQYNSRLNLKDGNELQNLGNDMGAKEFVKNHESIFKKILRDDFVSEKKVTVDMEMSHATKVNQSKVNNVKKDFYECCPYQIGSNKALVYISGNNRFDPILQLEVIDEFEKYKNREWIQRDFGQSFISELCMLCMPAYKNGIKTDGKIVSKRFIDIAEKVTERDNEMRDAAYVMSTFGDYYKDMDKETILRYIKLMQKISYQRIDHFDFELKLVQTPFSNDPDIKKELDILKEATKDFPQVDRRFNR